MTDIAAGTPGQRFDSVLQIMQRYGVSQATVDRAIGQLRREGYLTSQRGKGIFINDKTRSRASALKLVDVIFFGVSEALGKPGFHTHLVDQLARLLGNCRASLRATTLPPDVDRARLIEHLEQLSPQAAIIMNLFDPEAADALRRRGIPYLLLFPNWPSVLPNSCLIDNRSIARLWISHLTALGHRQIAYLHGCDNHYHVRDMSERLRYFYENMNRAGLLADPDLLRYGGFTPESGYEATKALLRCGKDFTALIINDHTASGVYQALHEAGRKIGRDVSVIGTDDLEWAAHLQPSLTTVRIPRRRLAAVALEKLQEMLETGDSFPSVHIAGDLVVRDSTGPVVEPRALSSL